MEQAVTSVSSPPHVQSAIRPKGHSPAKVTEWRVLGGQIKIVCSQCPGNESMIDTAPVLIKEKRVHYHSLDVLKGNKYFFYGKHPTEIYVTLAISS